MNTTKQTAVIEGGKHMNQQAHRNDCGSTLNNSDTPKIRRIPK
jgi:hypothetical protein